MPVKHFFSYLHLFHLFQFLILYNLGLAHLYCLRSHCITDSSPLLSDWLSTCIIRICIHWIQKLLQFLSCLCSRACAWHSDTTQILARWIKKQPVSNRFSMFTCTLWPENTCFTWNSVILYISLFFWMKLACKFLERMYHPFSFKIYLSLNV